MNASHIVFLEYKTKRLMLTMTKNERIFDLRLKASSRFKIDPKSFIMKVHGVDLSKEESQYFSDYFRKKGIVTISIEESIPEQAKSDKTPTGFSLKKYLLNLSVLNPQSSDASPFEASINVGLLKLNQRKLKLNFKSKLANRSFVQKMQSSEIKEIESNQKHIQLLKLQTSELKAKMARVESSTNQLPIVRGLSVGFKPLSQVMNIKRYNTESLKEKEISVNNFEYEHLSSQKLESEHSLPLTTQTSKRFGLPNTERLKPIIALNRRETRLLETSSDKSSLPTPQSNKKIRFAIAETSDPTQFINMDRKFRISPIKAQAFLKSPGINN